MASIRSLTDEQTELFEAIEKGPVEKALQLLASPSLDVSCYDSSRMTPLSAAAYRGHSEIAAACLKKGADVNDKQHEHGYTPLMFAALAGKPELCKLLMDHGAKSYAVNKIGKTASELAAFVGQHECVSIINNHISLEEVDRFLHPKGREESEEKFPAELTEFIHDLCKSHRVHPIALVFRLSEYPDAMKYKKKILYVIDRVFERQLRCKESNEVMSLKLWLILFILRETVKFIEEKSEKEPQEMALQYAKWLLFWEPGQQVRPNLETLLRNAVRAFPYRQSLLFETMVKAMSKVPFGSRPTSFDFIVQGLFGQRLLACSKFCATCGASTATKRCPKCKLPYCSQACQKFDWSIHKKCCASIKEWNAAEQEQDNTLSVEDLQAQIQEIDV